jgi:hypothetical protein
VVLDDEEVVLPVGFGCRRGYGLKSPRLVLRSPPATLANCSCVNSFLSLLGLLICFVLIRFAGSLHLAQVSRREPEEEEEEEVLEDEWGDV